MMVLCVCVCIFRVNEKTYLHVWTNIYKLICKYRVTPATVILVYRVLYVGMWLFCTNFIIYLKICMTNITRSTHLPFIREKFDFFLMKK